MGHVFNRNHAHDNRKVVVSALVKTFTTEEQCILQGNPYIESVRGTRVSFTDEFRDLALQEFIKGTKTYRQIFQYFGINPDLLGEDRINKFFRRLKEKVASNEVGNLERMLDNPYLSIALADDGSVSEIRFTEEFKELAYQEFVKGKKTVRDILTSYGIDPDFVGAKRIEHLTAKLRAKLGKAQLPASESPTKPQAIAYNSSQIKQEAIVDMKKDTKTFSAEELTELFRSPHVVNVINGNSRTSLRSRHIKNCSKVRKLCASFSVNAASILKYWAKSAFGTLQRD